MNSQEPIQFEDAELKAAIRRLWPAHVASDATRQRVEEILRGDRPQTRMRIGWFPSAIAAVLVLGLIGIVAYRLYEAAEYREYIEANHSNFQRLVAAHRAAAPSGEAAMSAEQLANRLGRPIASLASTAGKLESGRTLAFGESVLAVLTYQGVDRISVVSLPASELVEAHDGFAYDIQIDGCQLVGAVRQDNLFCIVAESGADPKMLHALMDHMTVTSP